jgi:hypothetical protein
MLVTDEMKRDFSSDGAIVARGLFTAEQLKRVSPAAHDRHYAYLVGE